MSNTKEASIATGSRLAAFIGLGWARGKITGVSGKDVHVHTDDGSSITLSLADVTRQLTVPYRDEEPRHSMYLSEFWDGETI